MLISFSIKMTISWVIRTTPPCSPRSEPTRTRRVGRGWRPAGQGWDTEMDTLRGLLLGWDARLSFLSIKYSDKVWKICSSLLKIKTNYSDKLLSNKLLIYLLFISPRSFVSPSKYRWDPGQSSRSWRWWGGRSDCPAGTGPGPSGRPSSATPATRTCVSFRKDIISILYFRT